MKGMKMGVLLLTAACMLSGCGSSGVELTTEQNDMIAEYIAGSLLRYDMRYEEKLIYTSTTEAVPDETTTEAPEDNETLITETDTPQIGTEAESPTPSYSSLSDLIGQAGLELTYQSSGIYDSYPKEESDYFVLEPSVSDKLLVVGFSLSNTSGGEKSVDLSTAGIQYSLTVGEKSYRPLLTALPNDLRYLTMTLAAGEKQEVVVVFEVDKDTDLSASSLTLTKDGAMAQISPLAN